VDVLLGVAGSPCPSVVIHAPGACTTKNSNIVS
jgi:hypothetical protein